jgi:hypothetical protein
VHNSGNSANTNVTSADVQVNPDVRARNESTNVVTSSNENDNDNDNRNDADADAVAAALNANVNANVGVNSVENSNQDSNTNSATNTGTNTNGPESAGQRVCESYGGTFTAVGSQEARWTCTNLPNLGDTPAFDTRAADLSNACTADGGFLFEQSINPPQDALCA